MENRIIKFKMVCDTGFAGCTHQAEDEIEVDANATAEEIESQIEEITKEWAYGMIDIYHVIKQ